jgi:hypothetical protein
VQINPSLRDIRAMIKDAEFNEVRVILDRENNLYVWDSDMAIHASVENALSLNAKDWDIWGSHDGDIISGREPAREMDDEEARVRGERMLELWESNQSTPHGAAAISMAADAGVLHLVEGLDKAGVDAIILPTAVSIDKRVGDVEKGYGASLEREAGLGAVAALDAYRARVAAAIKADKKIPSLDVDLVKLAGQHQRAQAKVGKKKSLLRAGDPDVDYIQDPETGRFQGSHGHSGDGSAFPACAGMNRPDGLRAHS